MDPSRPDHPVILFGSQFRARTKNLHHLRLHRSVPPQTVTKTHSRHTADEEDAETEATVYAYILGSNGSSGKHILSNSLEGDSRLFEFVLFILCSGASENFQRGGIDTFHITFNGDLGQV